LVGSPASAPCIYQLALSATPSAGALPLVVHFNATVSSGQPSWFNWSFGDGSFWNSTVAGASSPFHRYSNAGLFNASVRVDEFGCQERATVSVAAVPGPLTVVITSNALPGVAPLRVTFNATVTGGSGTYVSAIWEFGDGHVGSGLGVAFTYDSPGEFTAVLNVTDSAGHWAVATTVVTVEPGTPPPPSPWGGLVPAAIYLGAGALAAFGFGWLLLRRRDRRVGSAAAFVSSKSSTGAGAVRPAPSDAQRSDSQDPESTSALSTVGIQDSPPRGQETPLTPVHSPDGGNGDRLRLTHRVLLHIGSQGSIASNDIAPQGLTQAGMAASLGVSQNSLTNVLRRLIAAGVLTQSVQHVQGRPRRLRVYRFTPRGDRIYRDLRGRAGASLSGK
jgi:PKD repeat protein